MYVSFISQLERLQLCLWSGTMTYKALINLNPHLQLKELSKRNTQKATFEMARYNCIECDQRLYGCAKRDFYVTGVTVGITAPAIRVSLVPSIVRQFGTTSTSTGSVRIAVLPSWTSLLLHLLARSYWSRPVQHRPCSYLTRVTTIVLWRTRLLAMSSPSPQPQSPTNLSNMAVFVKK